MQTISGAELRRMILSAAASIEIHKQDLNELNVFPVPDGDTGTNMSMTIHAAAADLRAAEDPNLYATAKIAASATLRGARGNSGVILSLLFKGIKRAMKGHDTCDGLLWADALQQGVDAAYKAVMKPAEGTILTVSRLAAAKAQEKAQQDNSVEAALEAALEEAKVALADTMNMNPVLKKAGVVDAGGKGWVLALEAMLAALRGQDVVVPESGADSPKEAANFSDFNTEDITFTYCTEFIIGRENKNDPEKLRAFLNSLGDSLVMVDDDEIIKCHVHTAHPGLALEKAATYGMLTKLKIENMIEQHKAQVESVKEQQKAAEPKAVEIDPALAAGFVAVAAGDGVQQLFTDLGVQQIVSGGQTMNPSTEDILHAAEQVPAMDVYVLPNNKNIVMAAEQAARLARTSGVRRIHVVPTTTIPQGISAMMAYDESAEVKANVEAMQEAAKHVQSGSVTFAARDSDYDGHQIHEGELLALENGKVAFTGTDLGSVTAKIAKDLMREDSQFITLLYGADVSEETAGEVEEAVRALLPEDVELTVAYGGQPVYYFLISVE